MKTTARTRNDEQLMLQGRGWHWKSYPLLLRIMWPAVGAASVVAAASLAKSERWELSIWFLIGGFWCLLRSTYLKHRSLRALRKSPDYKKESELFFTDEEIEVRSPSGQATIKWSALHEIVLTPEGILFYPQKHLHAWIPKAAFRSEAEYRDTVAALEISQKVRSIH